MASTMHEAAPVRLGPSTSVWVGRVISGLVVAFFVMDAGIKIPPLDPVIDAMRDLGWPVDPATSRALAALMLIFTALYAFPLTSVLGAILITAYLGGAVATHVRIGSPLLTHTLFGVYLGILTWLGLWLRNPQLRAVLPILLPR